VHNAAGVEFDWPSVAIARGQSTSLKIC
jgi:hypothetical protein